MKSLIFFTVILLPSCLMAQATVAQPKKVPLCNPLIVGSIPKKALSFQYEYQSQFDVTSKSLVGFPLSTSTLNFKGLQGFKLAYNKNIITKPTCFASLDVGYSNFYFNNITNQSATANPLPGVFNNASFHAITASTNIFKPLDSKHFLLFNVGIEFNGNTASIKKPGARNLFGTGAILYGIKKSYTAMWGFGVLRAYRLGRVVHVPALLWNKSFTKKWGVEMLLPARAIVRLTPGTKTIFTAGYELEGNQFAISSNNAVLNNSFFQRGEIRPKLGYETQLSKNVRFSANAGIRFNGRFNIADKYDGKQLILENTAKPNVFVNVGLSIMSLKKKK